MSERHFVLAAGGTGGHMMPAHALAEELTRRGHRVAQELDGLLAFVTVVLAQLVEHAGFSFALTPRRANANVRESIIGVTKKIFDKANTYDGSNFSNGKAPYAIVGPWSIDGLNKAGVKYQISSIPSINGGTARAFSGVTAVYMNRYAKNKFLAKQYLVEVVQSAAFSKAITTANNSYPANIEAASSIDPSSVAGKFGAYGAVCIPMPNVSEMNQVWTYWNNSFADWASGKAKFGAAMESASKNLNKALSNS